MSALAPARAPARRSSPPPPAAKRRAPARPPLRLVEAPVRQTVGRIAFTLLVAAILVGGLLVLLLVHTLAAQDGFQVHALQSRLATLQDQEQSSQVQLARLRSPAHLSAQARKLGMRPTAVTSYQRLRDGRVVALAQPIIPPPPAYVPAPTPSAPAKKSAKTTVTTTAAKDKAAKPKTTTTAASGTRTATTNRHPGHHAKP